MCEAVLFDFGGTLDADGVPWKERALRLYREEGVAASPEAFDPLFYRADDALVGALPPRCSLLETATRLFAAVTEELRPGDHELARRVTERFVADIARHAATSASILSRLRSRYRLGLVSNFYGNLSAVCDDLGLSRFFGVIIDSTTVGHSKPDPRIFEMALAGLGVAAQDAVFVGDSLRRDMAGARGVGMPHVWLVGEGETASRACCPGDPIIRSLDELEALLGSPTASAGDPSILPRALA
jgi:putative hydrolase of the HAD superfamily